jgi:GNAT superfamily N-acetyltransferase
MTSSGASGGPPGGAAFTIRLAEAKDLAALVALQEAAYRPNEAILGVTPLPLQADYRAILESCDVWLAERGQDLLGALILERYQDHLMIFSVAVAPAAQGHGIGHSLLALAEEKAGEAGLKILRLYTGEKLQKNVEWYQRNGYVVERVEALSDRRVVHMIKQLG